VTVVKYFDLGSEFQSSVHKESTVR